MSKRSDFAQKLLDDLRLRKERMASSQGSKGSKPLPVDVYDYSKQAYKGSRTEVHNIGLRNGSARSTVSQGGRSVRVREASTEIVPFRRDHRSMEQAGDLSMALAFALENGGKLGAMNSSSSGTVLRFLQQMGKRSGDFGRMERAGTNRHKSSSGHLPGLSHFHIQEVSKGAQKLNQILRAWSSGLSLDRYSVEIGKELLKGAIDLEESLQMLANLQESSDQLITPQTKARITLLDEEEDDRETAFSKDQNKQLARPRFSFDKSSGSSHYPEEVRRQAVATLAYRAEAKHSKNDPSAYGASSLVSHRSGYSLDSKPPAAVSEQKSQSSASSLRQHKARMPNIIAKLMGLEDLPKDSNPVAQKESGNKPKNEGIAITRTADVSTSAAKKESKTVENLVSLTKTQKQTQSSQVQVGQGRYHLPGQKDQAIGSDFREAKPPAIEVYDKVSLKIDHHSKISQSDRITGRRKESKERQQDNAKLLELHGRGKESERLIQSHELQLAGSQSGLEPNNTSPLRIKKDVPVSNNGLISSPDHGIRQSSRLSSPERQNVKHQAAMSQQPLAKKKVHVTRKKGGEEIPRKTLDFLHNAHHQRKDSHRDKHRENLVQEKHALISSHKANDPNERNGKEQFFPGHQKPELPPVNLEKHLSVQVPKKEKPTRTNRTRKIDEPMTRPSGGNSPHLSSPLKQQQASILQEMKQRMRNRPRGLKEAEMQETRSRSTQVEPSPANPDTERSNASEEPVINAVDAPHSIGLPMVNHELGSHVNEERSQEIVSTGTNDQKTPESCREVEELGVKSTDQAQPDEEPEKPPPKPEVTPEPLTENENHLKKILVSSQAFLKAAQALFKLDVPLGTHHRAESQEYTPDQESQLLIDCGYEIMRRKGRKLELGLVYPLAYSVKMTIRTLDELIRQLRGDFGKLESYGRSGVDPESSSAAEDQCYQLPGMLEWDMYNKLPDANCMWECGWEGAGRDLVGKDEVVREVERFVLNGLLDEVTWDMMVTVF